MSSRPALTVEALEPRILLSATWVEADTGDAIPDATEGDDIYTGSDQADVANALGGDDVMDGGKGDDQLFGGAGNDQLFGGQGKDTLDGGTGDDQLFGGTGNDTLISGGGNDTLDGGIGNDTFKFDGAQNGDVITVDGGIGGQDTIDLSGYTDDQINDDGSTITVDMGNGESFTINYTNIEEINTGGPANNDPGPDDEAPSSPNTPDAPSQPDQPDQPPAEPDGNVPAVPDDDSGDQPTVPGSTDDGGARGSQWDGNEDLQVMDASAEMTGRVEFLSNWERGEVSDLEPTESAEIESRFDLTSEVELAAPGAGLAADQPDLAFDVAQEQFGDVFEDGDSVSHAPDAAFAQAESDRDLPPVPETAGPPLGEAHVESDAAPEAPDDALFAAASAEPVGFFARLWGLVRGTAATSRHTEELVGAPSRDRAGDHR